MATSSFLNSSFNKSFTFFIVTSKINNNLEGTTSNQGTIWYSGGNSNIIVNTNNLSPTQITQSPPDSALITNPTLETFRYDGAEADIRFNGKTKSVPTTGNLGLSGALTIGSLSNDVYYYHGDIAEIIAYNNVLTNTQVEQIESYLLNKYGITDAMGCTPYTKNIF